MGHLRNRVLGRCAGLLFLAGALAALPAHELLRDPEPAEWARVLQLVAAVSGVLCLLIPWHRIHRNWLHVLPPLGIAQITLTAIALKTHGEVFQWYMTSVALLTAYAFRRRLEVVAHMLLASGALLAVGVHASSYDVDALPRAIVAIPTLAVCAGVVVWLRENLERRERTDPLTGLANRRALMGDLERVLAEQRVMTLALFDLDGFKRYNDRLGHAAGDGLLQRLGGRLADAVTGHGTAYRLGGDELCVLVDDPILLADCTRALREGPITASAGAVRLPTEARTSSTALSLADDRMYEDKKRPRGEASFVAVLSPSPGSPSAPRSSSASASASASSSASRSTSASR